MRNWSFEVSDNEVVVYGSPSMSELNDIMTKHVNRGWIINTDKADQLNATFVFSKKEQVFQYAIN